MGSSTVFDSVVADAVEAGWNALPVRACSAIAATEASPRLIAHLILVHDAAVMIVDGMQREWPDLTLDWEAIAVGAAIHDIGKAFVPEELVGPGKTHERAGEAFLRANGLSASLAKYARTHGYEVDSPELGPDDRIVILADKLWRGARRSELEERIARDVGQALGLDFWDVYPSVLDLCDAVCEKAADRLAWQSAYPAT